VKFSVIIPARFAASRLPGKLLLDLAGKPVLRHGIERALASAAHRVVVATDDARIAAVGESAGAEVAMTSPDHPTGTDRIQQACALLGLGAEEIVVNVQGDEPLIPVAAINQVADDLRRRDDAGIATLCEEIADSAEFGDPNVVKVVRDLAGYALYFSREAIPHGFDGSHRSRGAHGGAARALRHIGIYAYRVATLDRFVAWPQTALERGERLEQLRALGHGVKIYAALASERFPPGIDTAKDLEAARAFLAASHRQAPDLNDEAHFQR